jgi:hypothetical protein
MKDLDWVQFEVVLVVPSEMVSAFEMTSANAEEKVRDIKKIAIGMIALSIAEVWPLFALISVPRQLWADRRAPEEVNGALTGCRMVGASDSAAGPAPPAGHFYRINSPWATLSQQLRFRIDPAAE